MTSVVGIYLFDDVEVLDFAGPYEVFSTASRVHARLQPAAPGLFEVVTIADRPRTVCARGGLRVEAERPLDELTKLDVLIVPGGDVSAELQRQPLIVGLTRAARQVSIIASVCTGAFLLAQAGLLDGRRATTHWEDLADLRQRFPAVDVTAHARWVDAGQIVTSAGISAGVDMCLHLVARLAGDELAVATARQMEFDWQRS